MKKLFFCNIVFFLLQPLLFAKEFPPPEIPSIVHKGKEYRASYRMGLYGGSGEVDVIEESEDGMIRLSVIKIYSHLYIPFKERVEQFVYISKMELADDNTIRIYNEIGQVFDLNLTDNRVKIISSGK
ncbi:hypothetical protein [Treponema zioleckii]|uniref:hypothetical protein n=1 Tax=Treponema zioleckii TaxID=331680 RepID=UPI00168BEBA5|nr:hypothetical protein [Treponema zioleckii]